MPLRAVVVAALAAVPPSTPADASEPPRFVPPLVHAGALMTTMRTVEWFLWPTPFAESDRFVERWGDSFTHAPKFDASRRPFEWDGDRWWINAVGHTLFGSELYLRARACHFGWAGALAWTTGASAVWEYAFEGNGVRPSAFDLVWTPVAGLLLGEARHALFRAASQQRGSVWATLARIGLDPLGGLEHAATGRACGW